jgi:hypothetical protein
MTKNYSIFDPKIVTKPLEVWVGDTGSELRDPGTGTKVTRVPDSDQGGQNSKGIVPHYPGSGSATLQYSTSFLASAIMGGREGADLVVTCRLPKVRTMVNICPKSPNDVQNQSCPPKKEVDLYADNRNPSTLFSESI